MAFDAAAALAACTRAGGGRVVVPAGVHPTGPLRLTSGVELHLSAGAVLVFHDDPGAYPAIDLRWEGRVTTVHTPLVFAEDAHDVSVTGTGTLDGSGQRWWDTVRAGSLALPRPRLAAFHRCRNVRVDGVRLVNSPSWTLHFIECEDVAVRGATLVNPPDSPNTDGINPESCRRVTITDCTVDVGDDCITLKSGTEANPRRVPCEDVTITGCRLRHGHGGVVIGSEMSGGVRSVIVRDCLFEGTDRGLRIKSRRGRGGVVEALVAEDLTMRGVATPFAFYLYYAPGTTEADTEVHDRGPRPVGPGTPVLRNVRVSRVRAEGANTAGFFYGLPESPLEDVRLDDVRVSLDPGAVPVVPAGMLGLEPWSRRGFYLRHTAGFVLTNVSVTGAKGPWVDRDDE